MSNLENERTRIRGRITECRIQAGDSLRGAKIWLGSALIAGIGLPSVALLGEGWQSNLEQAFTEGALIFGLGAVAFNLHNSVTHQTDAATLEGALATDALLSARAQDMQAGQFDA